MTVPATMTIVPGASRLGLAWMATAGVAVAMDKRARLEFAWRYADLGEVRIGQSVGRVIWRDGSRETLPLDPAPTQARLAGHGIRLSVRYAFSGRRLSGARTGTLEGSGFPVPIRRP